MPALIDYLGLIMTPTVNPAPGDVPIRGSSGGWTTAPVGGAPAGKVFTIDPATNLPAWLAAPLQITAPAATGDVTGALDYAALAPLLAAGHRVKFSSGQSYYINQTFALPAGSYAGWEMPEDTTITWAGAAGGSVIATPAYTGASMAPYFGSLIGGRVIYPKAKITAATKVIYLAMPSPGRITTDIETDDANSNTFIAGSAGLVLDGNMNPGNPFVVETYVNGQFDKNIYCRASHVKFLGNAVAYGNDGIVFDNDSLATAAPPINCEIIGAHTWKMVRSMCRLVQCGNVAIIGGSLEQGSTGGFSGSAAWVYADTTFNTGAHVFAPWNVGGSVAIGSILKHFGSGTIRWMDLQNHLDAIYAGNSSTGVPTKLQPIYVGTMPVRSNTGGTATAAATDVIVVSPGNFPLSSLINNDTVVVTFIGWVTCTSPNPVNLKLWQSSAQLTEGSAPGGTLVQLGSTVQVTAGVTATPISMSATGSTAAQRFYGVSAASPNAVSVTVGGVLRVQPL